LTRVGKWGSPDIILLSRPSVPIKLMEWEVAPVDSSNIPEGTWVNAIELHNGLWGFHVHFVDP
jgi:hypothetical protein